MGDVGSGAAHLSRRIEDVPRSGSHRQALRWALKAAVSALFLAVILWLLPTHEVWAAMARLPLWLWVGVLALFLIGHVVAASKWWWLALHTSGIPFGLALRAHFTGLVANLCLPGVAGGDIVRAALVIRGSLNKSLIAAGSLADRILDSVALLLLAGLGALLSVGEAGWSPDPLWSIGALILLCALAATLAAILLPRLPKVGLVGKVLQAFHELGGRGGALLLCLFMSLVVQSGFIGLTIALAAAAGVTTPAAVWFFAWPLAKLIAIAPISLAGLGVREASLAALMTPFGANPAQIVACGLLWQSILFAGGAVGGLCALVGRGRSMEPGKLMAPSR